MEFLNIGIPELIVILVLMLILLGPDEMVKTARTIAITIRKIIRSPYWAEFMRVQSTIKDLPTQLVREAGLNDTDEFNQVKKDLSQVQDELNNQVNAINQSLPEDAYRIRPYSQEYSPNGNGHEPVGPLPDIPPAAEPDPKDKP
jgi:sec-independent protein translocase protein TatB